MRYRHREQYQAVIAKRRYLKEREAYSDPDQAGSRVAILTPFIEELVYDQRDDRSSFESQNADLANYYAEQGRNPYVIMDATIADFEAVLADRSVPSVVVAGFGGLPAVAVPFSKDRARDARFGYLDWLHLAGMATHLKLGKFVMYTCCEYTRVFNPPLPSGVVSSHRNIRAPLGLGIYATGVDDNEPLMLPVSDQDELTYDQIKERFPLQRHSDALSQLPDAAYLAARGVYNYVLQRDILQKYPPASIPHPDLRGYVT